MVSFFCAADDYIWKKSIGRCGYGIFFGFGRGFFLEF